MAAVGYLLFVEAIYTAYFLALPSTAADGTGMALPLGLLVTAITLPASIVTSFIQGALNQLMGYGGGLHDPLWPNFVAFQVGIAINTYLVHCIVRRLKRRQAD